MNITQESLEMPNEQVEYQNRNGDIFTFELLENGNVEWEGDFDHCRFGYDKDPMDFEFVDPAGGPHIKKGQMLSHVIKHDDFNVIELDLSHMNLVLLLKLNHMNMIQMIFHI